MSSVPATAGRGDVRVGDDRQALDRADYLLTGNLFQNPRGVVRPVGVGQKQWPLLVVEQGQEPTPAPWVHDDNLGRLEAGGVHGLDRVGDGAVDTADVEGGYGDGADVRRVVHAEHLAVGAAAVQALLVELAGRPRVFPPEVVCRFWQAVTYALQPESG